MKKLVLILLTLLVCSLSRADQTSYELVGGSITDHLILENSQVTNHFQNKIGDNGKLIYNPLFGVRRTSETDTSYYSFSAFGGDNCIGQPMYGGMTSFGIKPFRSLYLGGVFGAYGQSDSKYLQSGAIPYKWTLIGDTDIVPIVGVEANIRVNLSNSTFLQLNNVITPLLTNTTLSLGVTF